VAVDATTEFEVEYTVLGAVDDGSTTSKYFEIEFSRMCEHFRTTRKTPSMKRLID